MGLTDDLPLEVNFGPATVSQGDCTETEGRLTCDLGDLDNTASAIVTIVATPTTIGLLTNTVEAAAVESDPVPDDNAATTTTNVLPQPLAGLSAASDSPVEVNKTAALSATITAGTHITYDWDFGDGAQAANGGPVVSHVYSATGLYTAIVTASNAVSVMTATTTVWVQEAITGLSVANDSPIARGDAITLTTTIASGTDVFYDWNFGDGQQTTGSAAEVAHAYTALPVVC